MLNDGNYRGQLSVTDALATSPNTAFAKLISQVGVQRAVDMAVKLGLRSYALPGTARDYDPDSNESLADFVKRQNLGSFTLGPIEVNPLELSNVAATLASGGTWCPPNPIDKVIDRKGKEVAVTTETCEQVVPEGLANTLANAMSKDDRGGTAAGAAGSAGWNLPVSGKTGHHRGAPVLWLLRLHQRPTQRPTTSTTTRPRRRTCARSRCGMRLRRPVRRQRAGPHLVHRDEADHPRRRRAAADRSALRRGSPGSRVPTVSGMTQDLARQRLKEAGFQVADQATPVNSAARRDRGRHLTDRSDRARIDHHDPDQQRHPTPTATPAAGHAAVGSEGAACTDRFDGREIPGLPPITVPVLGPPPPPPPPCRPRSWMWIGNAML